MGGRTRVGVAVMAIVMAASLAVGCSPSQPNAGPARTDPTSSVTTTVTVPRPTLPEVTPDASIQVPAGSVEGPPPIQKRVLAADVTGSWVLQAVAGDPAIVRLDPAGVPGRVIALPIDFVNAADPAVVDGITWLAGSRGEPGERTFHLVRVDLAAGTAEALASEAIIDQIDVIDGTTWVVTGGSSPTTRAYTSSGPQGPGTALPPRDRDGALGPITTVTPAATFSCLAGAWTATPHGGTTRDLGSHGSGCNAAPVGGDLLITADDHLWRLSATGAIPIDGPPVRTCAGPRQPSTDRIALVCQVEPTRALEIHRVDLAANVATVERSLGSGFDMPTGSAFPARSGPGLPLAYVRLASDDPSTTPARGVLLVLGTDGVVRAGSSRDRGAGWRRWTDDAVWVGDSATTWSRLPAAAATG